MSEHDIRRIKAEVWAECVATAEELGWLHDLAADDMAGRNPYAPFRPEGGDQ